MWICIALYGSNSNRVGWVFHPPVFLSPPPVCLNFNPQPHRPPQTSKQTHIKCIYTYSHNGHTYRFEVPKRVHIEFEPFSVENDLLTPTFKLKRQQAQAKYQREIADMYAQLQRDREQQQSDQPQSSAKL